MDHRRPGRTVAQFVSWGSLHGKGVFLGKGDRGESKSILESQSQNHSQKRRIQVPQTIAYGVFDGEFDFDSQEWICSVPARWQLRLQRI